MSVLDDHDYVVAYDINNIGWDSWLTLYCEIFQDIYYYFNNLVTHVNPNICMNISEFNFVKKRQVPSDYTTLTPEANFIAAFYKICTEYVTDSSNDNSHLEPNAYFSLVRKRGHGIYRNVFSVEQNLDSSVIFSQTLILFENIKDWCKKPIFDTISMIRTTRCIVKLIILYEITSAAVVSGKTAALAISQVKNEGLATFFSDIKLGQFYTDNMKSFDFEFPKKVSARKRPLSDTTAGSGNGSVVKILEGNIYLPKCFLKMQLTNILIFSITHRSPESACFSTPDSNSRLTVKKILRHLYRPDDTSLNLAIIANGKNV
jgi:hypothetical protein